MTKLAEKSGYQWVIAVICSLSVTVAVGFFYNTLSLFMATVTDELGIPRSLYAASTLTSTAVSIVMGAAFGKIVTRFRSRLLMLFAAAGLIAATVVYACARSAAYFFVFWFLEGSCVFFCSTSMISYVVGRWFTEHRGAVMGAVMAGSGIGTAVGTQVLRPVIIGDRTVFGFTGFRAAICIDTALFVLLFLLILLLFRDPPAENATDKKKNPAIWEGRDWEAVRRGPLLYLVGACLFLTNVAMHSPLVVSAAHLEDVGIEPSLLTNVATAYAVVLCLGKFLAGISYEKIGLTATMTVCNLSSALSTVCLYFVTPDKPGFALAHEILLGCAIPMEMVMTPLIVSDQFGEKTFAKITGLYYALMCVGFAVGNLLTNWFYDSHGEDYRPILLVYAGVMLLVTAAEPFVFALGKKKRAAFLAERQTQ